MHDVATGWRLITGLVLALLLVVLVGCMAQSAGFGERNLARGAIRG